MSRSRILSSILVSSFTSGIKETEHEMVVFQLVNFIAARMFSTVGESVGETSRHRP